MTLSLTLIIIIATVIVSVGAFNNQKVMDDLIFYPPAITRRKQWYRFFTCGFIHADWAHLFFNMYVLYIFGGKEPIRKVIDGIVYRSHQGVESEFKEVFGSSQGGIFYLLMYFGALAFCLFPTFAKHKDDYHYRSLGASGAVSAVIFSSIIFNPTAGMGLLFLPIAVPGILFGLLYLGISTWLMKRGGGNINHSAHIWGALFGIVFTFAIFTAFGDPEFTTRFIDKVSSLRLEDLFRFG